MFHSRCKTIETTLLTRIKDLEDRLEDRDRAHQEELMTMWERMLTVVNPSAAAALRSMQPTPSMPAGVAREGGAPRLRRTLPGMRPAAPGRSFVHLTPGMEAARRHAQGVSGSTPAERAEAPAAVPSDMQHLENEIAAQDQ